MENRSAKIYSPKSKNLTIKVIPGHFATNHSHINYYLDMTGIKYHASAAKEAAAVLAAKYMHALPIDTIICMDGCEVVGAYLAGELSKADIRSLNSSNDICIISPEFNTNGQMIFRDNIQPMVWGKNVLLLVASVTTGKTINRSLECIKYYSGNVRGISAIFSAIPKKQEVAVDAIFTMEDLPDYQTYSFADCPYCAGKHKIDAIVNSFGYSKI